MEYLKPYFPPAQDESLISWLNRFGQFHCGLLLNDFLHFVGIPLQELHMGRQEVFSRVSAISGQSVESLKIRSHEYLSDRRFAYRGETFFREFLLRSAVTFCPACLLSDYSESGTGAPKLIGRTGWAFRSVRTCEHHATALCRTAPVGGSELALNISAHAPDQERLEKLLKQSPLCKPSALQNYIIARFEGHKGPRWLDDQQIDLASRATEMLGACVEYGAQVPLTKLTEAEWDKAGQVGFEFTSKGENGIREGLELLFKHPHKNTAQRGPQGVFGKLFQWVQFRKNDKPVGPIKEILRESILDTFPIAAGTDLFGEITPCRKKHSVATLSAHTGVHAKTVANALARAGMLPKDLYIASSRQTVPAGPAEELIEKLKRAVPVAKIPEYIGCTRSQASLLIENGILHTVIQDTGNRTARYKGVDLVELRQLLKRMRHVGKPVDKPSKGNMTIGVVAKKLNVSSMEVLSLLLKGNLEKVELLSEDLKFCSVLVDLEEVAEQVGAKTGKLGMTVSATARALGVTAETVQLLLNCSDGDQGALELSGQVRHMGIMRDLVDQDSVTRFKKRYLKLSLIDGFWAGDPDRLRAKLARMDILPVWEPTMVNAEFYRLSDL